MRGLVVKIGRERILLVADTHVGYEVELRLNGIYATSQTARLRKNLIEWGEEVGANTLAILGDIKHELPVPRETASEVREFLKDLSKSFERVILIPGNHDSMIDEIADGIQGVYVADSRGVLLEGPRNVLLLHGHAKPRPEDLAASDVLVMGHTHPALSIVDEIGYISREPVILKITQNKGELFRRMFGGEAEGGYIKVVVLPASHPLITGYDIINLIQLNNDERTIMKYMNLDYRSIEVYLTDFTFLGTLDVIAESKEESRLEMVTS